MVLTGLSGGRPILAGSQLPATSFHRNHIGTTLAVHGRLNPTANRFSSAAQWIIVQVGISLRGGRLGVSQQFANYRQPKAAARTEGRIRVAEIVQANTLQASTSGDSFPRTFQIGTRLLGIISRHNVRAVPIEPAQYRHCGGIQDYSLAAALAVGKKQQASLKIDVFPPEMQHLPQPASGEQQEAKGRPRERTDLGIAIFCLWKVPCRGLRFINDPRNAFRLCLSDGCAEPLKLCAGEESLATVFLELVDLADGIGALLHGASSPQKCTCCPSPPAPDWPGKGFYAAWRVV